MLEELESLGRPVPEQGGEGEEEETDLVRVLRDIKKNDEGSNLFEKMTEYFTKERTQLEEEPAAETSTSEKRQRREDVVRFGDLSLEELMDEDEGPHGPADG